MWESLPEFGTGVLYAVLVTAAYTFAVCIGAGRGNPKLLKSARQAAYGTCALILLGVLILAYAFVTHDFRLSYVARYSERSMTVPYLFASLWGGQDGSLLWWSFLLSIYVTACVRWMRGKYRELQPYVIATLMVIIGFFAILMLFAANPFATNMAGARLDGEGLNPLLRNFYMIIHPPSLYTGFVGCSIPFAFCIAALVTGRLGSEWIIAVRKWMLFAWLFLTIGNALGMLWAYEELGWGGYWAWDPVENAACLPWFTASAYVHSTMIQERRNMLKTWNIFLICLTFFLTIFGTFLTRSGLIASVHSFAQSNIGIFFVWFMGFIVAVCAALMIWRYPMIKSKARIEAAASREAMFVFNNWALLGMMTFIAVATLFPKISEWIWQETATVGPPFFNRWLAAPGIFVFALMGLAPLFGWRKTSTAAMKKAFIAPMVALTAAAVAHLALGKAIGFPAIVPNDRFYPGFLGTVLQQVGALAPLLVVSLSAFNVAVIVQEFARGVKARQRNKQEGVLSALYNLVERNRRRYGGYTVHLGIVLIFLGFTGRAWGVDTEASMTPGQGQAVGDYNIVYNGTRMEVDTEKRMVFADVTVQRKGKDIGVLHPAKFIYAKGGTPTTEVAMLHTFRDDVYVIVGSVSPQTKRATFQFHINPLVSWIWAGVLFMMLGAGISLFPELSFSEVTAWSYVRVGAGAASGILFAMLLGMAPTDAFAGTAPRASERTSNLSPSALARRDAEARQRVGPWWYGAPLVGLVLGGVLVAGGRRRRRG